MFPKTPLKHVGDFFYSLDDNRFQSQLEERILSKFKGSYTNQIENASYEKNCGGKFSPQSQQLLVASYININTPYRGLVLWHGLGSGKTFSSIMISKSIHKDYNVITILPAMLVDNYRNELVNTNVITKKDIGEKYYYYTSNGQIHSFEYYDIQHFKNSLLIFDESQLIVSKILNAIIERDGNSKYYTFYRRLCEIDNLKIACLSGTPIVKDCRELGILFNMLYGTKKAYIGELTINENINETVILKINKLMEIIQHHLNGLTIANFVHPPNSDLELYIDIAKSRIEYIEQERKFIFKLYKNSQNYCNQFVLNNNGKYIYLGMKYEKNNNTFVHFHELITNELGSVKFFENPEYLFNISIKDKSMKNIDTSMEFENRYSLILPAGSNDKKYKLKHTNEEREYQLTSPEYARNYQINNKEEFIEKTKGLLSYFKNIERVMPNKKLLPNHKYGYDNTGHPLFNIKQCVLSEHQTKIINELKNSSNREKIQYLYKNSEHFVYPKYDYEFIKDFYTDKFKEKMNEFINANYFSNEEMIELNNMRISKKNATIIDKLLMIDRKYYQRQNIMNPSNVYAMSSITPELERKVVKMIEEYKLSNPKKNIVKSSKLKDYYIEKEEAVETIWNIEKFRDENIFAKDDLKVMNVINKNQILPLENGVSPLQQYSSKFYEIIKTILENPNELHIVYIEFLQIIIPFVRALESNNFTEYDELKDIIFSGGNGDGEVTENNKRKRNLSIDATNQNIKRQKNTSKKLKKMSNTKKVLKKYISKTKSEKINHSNKEIKVRRTTRKGIPTFKVKEQEEEERKNIIEYNSKFKYMFLTGSGDEPDSELKTFTKYLLNKNEGKTENKDKLINIFNSEKNKKGQRINVVILNSAASEGITLKNVRYVHMLHPPSNMSRLFQIFGRAIRTCSHSKLEENERDVCAILYLSSYSQQYKQKQLTIELLTRDEEKYEEIVNENDKNIPYLNLLKPNAIDAML